MITRLKMNLCKITLAPISIYTLIIKMSQWLTDFLCCAGVPSEKAKAPHFSTLTWKIPWMEEPGRLQSMGSLRVGHD